MKDDSPRTYICAWCDGEFLKTVPDQEAIAEMERYFGPVPEQMISTVCDDCYQRIHPDNHPQEVAKSRDDVARSRSNPDDTR